MTNQEQVEQVAASANALDYDVVAIEALWDGDTTGWFIRMSAITTDSNRHHLGFLRFGSDMRVFSGVVPPWPEPSAAIQLGEQLAKQLGAEFYFPARDYPEDECPGWLDRDRGIPCKRCQVPLIQSDRTPWRGLCSRCRCNEQSPGDSTDSGKLA